MEKYSLQSSETQTPCEDTEDSDSDHRVEENMKLTESLRNGAGDSDDAGGITGGIGYPMKGASYPYTALMTRCNLKVIKKIRKNLHSENLEKFEQSCFGPLLKLNQINQLRFQGRLMWQLLLHMDTRLSNEERLVFRVHDSNIEFRPSDFGVMTSLHCYGVSEPTIPSSSSIIEKVFPSRLCLKLKDVKKAFITASRENEGQGERTLKLALLYFLYGVLLPRQGTITRLNMKYLHLVEDLETFNAFPWGRVAYEFLAKYILSVRRRIDNSKGAVKNFDMYGFTYALQTWAYEVMPSVAAYCASRASKLGYPRILHWSATKQKQLSSDHLYKLFILGDGEHLMLEGIQTSSEKKIKIRMGESKWTTPLCRRQLKKRKLKHGKDHLTRNILLERNKSMRKAIRKLKAKKLESHKDIELYKKKFGDLGPKVDDSAAVEAEEEEIKSLADGNEQHEDVMSAEVDAINDHSVESGLLKRGSRSSAHSGPAAECSESGVAVQENQGKESDAGCLDGEVKMSDADYSDENMLKEKMAGAGCSVGEVSKEKMTGAGCSEVEVKMEVAGYSDGEVKTGAGCSNAKGLKEKMVGASCSVGEVPKEEMAGPSSAARAGAVIIEISSDDETGVDSSDDESCSDARIESLVAMLERKAKRQKMDV